MVSFFFFFQLGLVILALLSLPLGLTGWGRAVFYKVLSYFLRFLIFLSFIRVKVRGLENLPRDRQLILAGNHPGLLEPMYMIAYLPVRLRIVADRSILRIPVLGRVLRTAGCLTYNLDHHDPNFPVSLLMALREGASVLIFPPSWSA